MSDRTIHDVDGRPVNLASPDQTAVPHIFLFESVYRSGMRTYLSENRDEALRASREEAYAMTLDEHLMACLWERMRAVTRLPWRIEGEDTDDPQQQLAANIVQKCIRRTPKFRELLRAKSWAVWHGRSAAHVAWQWQNIVANDPRTDSEVEVPGLVVRRHFHVNGDKIRFRHDHVPVIMVNAAEADALKTAQTTYTERGRAIELVGGWRERFLLHTFGSVDADFSDGERADSIHGLGLRSYLYWSWWLKQDFLAAVIQALDRLGLGLVVLEFDEGNLAAKQEALDAAKNLQSKRSVLVIPRLKGATSQGAVKVVDTPVAGAQVMQMLSQAAELRQERLIIGQTASSRSDTSGMGTHDTEAQQNTKYEIIEEDAQGLAESMTGNMDEPGMVSIIQKYACPWAKFPLHFKFDLKPPDPERELGAASMAFNMGVTFKEDEVRGKTGFSKPGPDDKVVQSPAFVQMQQQLQMQAQMQAQGQVPGQQPGQEPDEEAAAAPGPDQMAGVQGDQQLAGQPSDQQDDLPDDPVFDSLYEDDKGDGDDLSDDDEEALEQVWAKRSPKPDRDDSQDPGEKHDLSPDELQLLRNMWRDRASRRDRRPSELHDYGRTGQSLDYSLLGRLQGLGDLSGGRPVPSQPPTLPAAAPPPATSTLPSSALRPAATAGPVALLPHASAPGRRVLLHDPEGVRRAHEALETRHLNHHDLAGMTGQDEGQVSIRPIHMEGQRPKIHLAGQHDTHRSHRFLTRGDDGQLVMRNGRLDVGKEHQGKGHGTRLFAAQVRALMRHGVDRIEARASRASGDDSYDTWAKLGYDGPIPAAARQRLPERFQKAETVQQLLHMPGGADAWLEHGDTFDGTFSLKPGSQSLEVLNDYLRRKSMPPADRPEDRIWPRVNQQGQTGWSNRPTGVVAMLEAPQGTFAPINHAIHHDLSLMKSILYRLAHHRMLSVGRHVVKEWDPTGKPQDYYDPEDQSPEKARARRGQITQAFHETVQAFAEDQVPQRELQRARDEMQLSLGEEDWQAFLPAARRVAGKWVFEKRRHDAAHPGDPDYRYIDYLAQGKLL